MPAVKSYTISYPSDKIVIFYCIYKLSPHDLQSTLKFTISPSYQSFPIFIIYVKFDLMNLNTFYF